MLAEARGVELRIAVDDAEKSSAARLWKFNLFPYPHR
jgi:hypothetical protein